MRNTQEQNLADLRAQALGSLALFMALIGYFWFLFVVWPITGKTSPPAAWLGWSVLVVAAALAFVLRTRHLELASLLLIAGTSVAVAAALLSWHTGEACYLFILPIVLSGLLLGQRAVVALAALAAAFSAAAAVAILGLPPYAVSAWLPVLVILLAATGALISAHSLYTALEWAWGGYERAHANESLARRQQAELRRALKALDEATYRLERANYMLTIARDQAEAARRLKQRFAQNISHELRTPLNLIVGFTELMAQSPDYYGAQLSPAFVRDLGIVHRNACHLQNLVNDVLDLARIEAARMALVPQEVDPGTLVQEAVNTARSLVEARGLGLRVNVEAGLPRLRIDPTRIRQVLFNLLSNAERFTEQGSITIGVRRAEDEVVFSVADTGVGIAPQDIPRLFEEFQQLDATTRRRYPGAGLGLTISRRFVELHGGRIWVESHLGVGSTFSFALPIARQDGIDGRGPQSVEAAPYSPALSPDDHVLLAVTPSPSAAALLRRYVQSCRTIVVQDLAQAQSAAEQILPQAVVIDTTFEALDPSALHHLGQAWALPRVPLIACPLPGEEPIRRRLQADGYLVKPITRQDLWDVLRRFGEDIDRVLVIDDDVDFTRLVARMADSPLRRYEVLSAYTAQEGLEIMRHQLPDLVLLDLMLPDIDGLQVIDRIRSEPAWSRVPIVVVSAQEDIDTLESLNGAMIIAKSSGLNVAEVVQWIQQVVNTSTQAGVAASGV